MIRITLRDGKEVIVEQGKRAAFNHKSDIVHTEAGATLDVFDSEGTYSGNVIASFLQIEVVGFVVENPPEDVE